jgi:hypothetical protein
MVPQTTKGTPFIKTQEFGLTLNMKKAAETFVFKSSLLLLL